MYRYVYAKVSNRELKQIDNAIQKADTKKKINAIKERLDKVKYSYPDDQQRLIIHSLEKQLKQAEDALN